jgi:hypothetical protein
VPAQSRQQPYLRSGLRRVAGAGDEAVRSALAERGRLRVGAVDVQIQPETGPADVGRIGRCLELSEDYFVVTQSVRAGLPVTVEVNPVSTLTHRPGQVRTSQNRSRS